MNKKINIVLLGILAVFLMVTTASAANVDDHAAGIGTMAHPTSSPGIAGCGGCHGTLGSATTSGFCTGCHGFPTFTLRVSGTPTSVTAGTATPVQFTVRNGPTNGPLVTGALVSLTGAGVPTGTSGSTVSSGLTTISVNAALAGTITATSTKTTSYTSGTTTLTASAPAPVLTTITVTSSTTSVLVGGTQAFAAAPKDQFGNPIAATITWSSSNTTVGTINATGTFTASTVGTTTVRATSGSVSRTAAVTVTESAPVVVPVLTTITVTPPTASVLIGGTQAFAATPKDQFGNPIAATITWSSSNTTVGTINAVGTFTALAAGTTTIKAASGAVNGTAAVTVTVTPPSTRKFSVTFIVTDSLTGNPIRDVKVSLKGKDIKTNNAGKAIFTNVASGTYEYKIEKDGYREIEGKITVARETTIALKLVKKSPRRTYSTRSHD